VFAYQLLIQVNLKIDGLITRSNAIMLYYHVRHTNVVTARHWSLFWAPVMNYVNTSLSMHY